MAANKADDPLMQNSWFWMGETLQAVLASSATVANACVLFSFTSSKPVLAILPRDVRYLYCNKAMAGLLISACILIKSLLTFIGIPTAAIPYYTKTIGGGHRRIYYFDGCQYQIGLATAAGISMVVTIMGTSLQRLLAAFAAVPTRNLRRVKQKQRLSAVLFLSVTWLIALAVALCVVLITPPRTDYWHECSVVYILPRSIIIAAVILVPIVTLLSVLMQVAAWLSTKREGGEDEQMSRGRTEEAIANMRDSNDNAIEKRDRIYTEASLTEMNLPSVLLFASCWSIVTLFLAYERLIPSFNPDSYLFNTYEKTPYYEANGGYVDTMAAPPTKTIILTQFFVYIPLLIEALLDPLCTYWKTPTCSNYSYSTSSTLEAVGCRDEAKDRLLVAGQEKVDEEKEGKRESKILLEEKTTELHNPQLISDDEDEVGQVCA